MKQELNNVGNGNEVKTSKFSQEKGTKKEEEKVDDMSDGQEQSKL